MQFRFWMDRQFGLLAIPLPLPIWTLRTLLSLPSVPLRFQKLKIRPFPLSGLVLGVVTKSFVYVNGYLARMPKLPAFPLASCEEYVELCDFFNGVGMSLTDLPLLRCWRLVNPWMHPW